uniref:C2 domain-containing protein n=1 Tax=Panagrolaimus sp. JU765 TaxID=591449 RepID=A0AC34QSE1_9BILA
MDLNLLNPADDLVIWIDLESIHDVQNKGGELNVCLQYLSSAQRLTLSVHQATGITVSGTVPSTFVKATLSIEGKVLKKRKTAIKKSATCPVWNEVLTFEVDPKIVNKCRLELSVHDAGTNKIIGVLVLGENTGHGSRTWREALKGQSQKPRWLPLVPPPASH